MSVQLDAPWAGESYSPPLRLDITHVETLIVERLREVASEGGVLRHIAIDHFPDQPERFRLTHRNGQVLVGFHASEFSSHPRSIDEVVQDEEMVWDVAVLSRDLGWAYGGQPSGGSPGAYAVLDAIKRALAGYQIPGFTRLVPRERRYVKHAKNDSEPGVWYYNFRFTHRCVAVNQLPDVERPVWQRTTFLEGNDLTSVPVTAREMEFDQTGAIQLPHGNVTDVVVSNDQGDPYAQDTDYTVDRTNGLILAVVDGALAAGSTVRVAYTYAEAVKVPAVN